jgi:hypothetical protein
MTDSIFKWYREIRTLIRKAEESKIGGATERQMVDEWKLTAEVLEHSDPSVTVRYDRWFKNQQSLTPEQIDFICYQIGDWYIEWKDRLVLDLSQGTHKLGFAKEELKTMICGD